MDFDDDVQPQTLAEWLARQRAEIEAARRQAHVEVDQVFDGFLREQCGQAELVTRDMEGHAQH